MPSQTHTTLDSGHSTPPSDDEVLVRVEGVSKKFCRSLKKSLWYGVCDIASEINPFGRTAAFANSNQSLTTDGSDGHGYGTAGGNQRADSAEFLEGHSQAGLQMDSEKLASIRSANDRRDSMDQTGSDSESVLIRDISGKKSSSGLVTSPTGEASLRDGEFFAVKDVSFELRRGECLGLIGHNGAGKTTLLKMLNGLIKPDAGSITMRGRVGALIALGAGFNPILTGRENIYINGSVLGLSKKEIDEKIDEIIDFAEIREFIDTPVQNYSSGMAVRLGFAVATTLDPDVLILDEVLAVGDAAFRAKCYKRIGELQEKAAVIFVSHSMDQMARIAKYGMLLDKGSLFFIGEINNAIKFYEEKSSQYNNESNGFLKFSEDFRKCELNLHKNTIEWGEDIVIKLDVNSIKNVKNNSISGVIYDTADEIVLSFVSHNNFCIKINSGENVFNFKIQNIELPDGIYKIGIALNKQNNIEHSIWSYKQMQFAIKNSPRGFCKYRKIIH